MKISRFIIPLIATLVMTFTTTVLADATANELDTWSLATNGLQARLTLVEKTKLNGTRWLVPFLELRNVRNLADQMEVRCDRNHLKIELVDADGKVVRDGQMLTRSGPVTQLDAIILPKDSSMRISLECVNWGIPKDAAAMVATDGGAWVIQESEKGKVYLRATLVEKKPAGPPYWEYWYGTMQTPLLKIDWKCSTNPKPAVSIPLRPVAAPNHSLSAEEEALHWGDEYQKADAEMNREYQKLLASGSVASQTSLRTAQRAWIVFRDAEAEYVRQIWEGGSGQNAAVASALAGLTRDRIRELQERY